MSTSPSDAMQQLETDTSRGALLVALEAAERDVAVFLDALAPAVFVARPGDAWSPAEHLEHLVTAVNAVARGLALPRWLLRLRFGRSRARSRGYVQLRDDYRAVLAAGGRATGRYVPAAKEGATEEPAVRRTLLLARWYRANQRLRDVLGKWSERDLDRIVLPHPLLGRLTAREMVLFTIYHAPHHVAAMRRRLTA